MAGFLTNRKVELFQEPNGRWTILVTVERQTTGLSPEELAVHLRLIEEQEHA